MNEEDIEFLSLIGSHEETTFNELCSALGDDCPSEKQEWAALFARIRDLERQCYIEVSRTGGKIDGLMLSESGRAMIRDRLDRKRGLLSLEGV